MSDGRADSAQRCSACEYFDRKGSILLFEYGGYCLHPLPEIVQISLEKHFPQLHMYIKLDSFIEGAENLGKDCPVWKAKTK